MTTSMPWVKIYTEILDDPKIARLGIQTKWRFIELLLVAGECDSEGYIVNGDEPLTIEDIAWRLRTTPEELQPDIDALLGIGIIDIEDDGALLIVNFSQRQGRSQAQKREQWRVRQQKSRESRARDSQEQEEIVTGDTNVTPELVTPLEERRVEESRGESARDNFSEMQYILEECIGSPIAPQPREVEAINELLSIGATRQDVVGALEFFRDNGKVARGAAHILNSVKYQVQKRTQGNHKSEPELSLEDQLRASGYTIR